MVKAGLETQLSCMIYQDSTCAKSKSDMVATLFCPFYTPASAERKDELLYTLARNISHKWIENIVLMIDDDSYSDREPPHPKVHIHRFTHRPMYSDWLRLSQAYVRAGQLTICANADIELSSAFFDLAEKDLQSEKTLLAISRYDISEAGVADIRDNPQWTQDTWVLRSDSIQECIQQFGKDLEIPFGIPRCDNRIAYVFWLRGWNIINPCLRVKTYHHHKSSNRDYSKKDVTILGGSGFVYPSTMTGKSSQIDINIFSLNKQDPIKLVHNKFLTAEKNAHCKHIIKSNASTNDFSRPERFSLAGRRLVPRGAINLGEWNIIHHYSKRLRLIAKGGQIAFFDELWPSILIYDYPEITSLSEDDFNSLFFWGFATGVTELLPHFIGGKKYYDGHDNFWQYPCRTEQDAYERHLHLTLPVIEGNVAHTYLGMPWATWIDRRADVKALMQIVGSRIQEVKHYLSGFGMELKVHTVCQHIRWKDKGMITTFEKAGITDLWIAHKEKGSNTCNSVRIHSWPLYAVNVLEEDRNTGLSFVRARDKRIFASFKGAYMKHYLSSARLNLMELNKLEGYSIAVNDVWHFNKAVYDIQVANKVIEASADEEQLIAEYNKLLSDTLFSLCPVGAGPNTLRLWESLGTGSIPVILSDKYELPSAQALGMPEAVVKRAVIEHPEDDIASLDKKLRTISIKECEEYQENGQKLFKASREMCCFNAGVASNTAP